MNLDDVVDDDSDEDAIDLQKGDANKQGSAAATASNDAEESKNEAINTTNGSNDSGDNNKSTGGSSGSGGNGSTGNLFAVGESTDKGLADMETGSEVYMSELLVSGLEKENFSWMTLKTNILCLFRLALIWKTLTRQRKRMRKT